MERMDSLKLLVDGQSITSETFSLKESNYLLDNGLIKVSEKATHTSNFVGYFSLNSKIIFSLPYGVNLENFKRLQHHEIRAFLIIVIKSIKRFNSHYQKHKEVIFSGQIEAATKLLEEYEENGFVTLFTKQYHSKTTGKINWNKTVKIFTPTLQNNSWIYDKFIKRKNVSHHNHDFILLQKWALKYALNKTYFVTDEYCIEEEFLENSLTDREARVILFRLKNSSNKDRELYILDLISILIGESDGLSSFAIYTKHFRVIWENALQQVLQHSKMLGDSLPNIDWEDNKNVIAALGLNLKEPKGKPEVDIIFEAEESLHILDAKYYDFVNNRARPSLTDLYKQLFYSIAFQMQTASENLPENGFIFPIFKTEKSRTFVQFSIVNYKFKREDSGDEYVAKIPAYFGEIGTILEAFVTRQNLQLEYLKIKK